MRNKKTDLAQRRALLKHIWQWIRVAPLPLTVILLLRLINAISRGAEPILIAGFTNALINGEGLFLWVGIYLLLMVLTLLTDTFKPPLYLWFSNKAILHFQNAILQRASEISLIEFLNPDFHDTLTRATHDFSQRIVNWVQSLVFNIYSIATIWTLIGAILIIGGGLKCVLIVFASSMITLLTRQPIANLEIQQDRALARPNREQMTWAALLCERESSAETRLFNIQHWLLSKWTDVYKKLATHEIRIFKKMTAWNAIATLATVLAYCSIIFIAAEVAHNGKKKEIAGIFTGLITATATLQAHFFLLGDTLRNLAKQSTILRELAMLLNTEDTPEGNKVETIKSDTDTSIEMDDLCFTYPRAAKQTLKDITAEIKKGETVAIVGKNGSGKTTLAHLLLGLYAPDSGTLRCSENNTRTKSAVFQNFAKFRLPIRDNVGFADVNRMHDDIHLQKTLKRVGSPFAAEPNTWLGQEFGGLDISGGEWLRIAAARGLFRESHLIVLDEPTASIDPIQEVEMIRQLLIQKEDSRTTLVISHRLGVARLCDRILVLDDGHLVENGTHADLLDKNGVYAQMWNTQAAWYV